MKFIQKNLAWILMAILIIVQIIILLKVAPQKYPWIIPVVGLAGILIGSITSYLANKYCKKQENFDKAYTSAILLRSWIFEKLSNITILRLQPKNLKISEVTSL